MIQRAYLESSPRWYMERYHKTVSNKSKGGESFVNFGTQWVSVNSSRIFLESFHAALHTRGRCEEGRMINYEELQLILPHGEQFFSSTRSDDVVAFPFHAVMWLERWFIGTWRLKCDSLKPNYFLTWKSQSSVCFKKQKTLRGELQFNLNFYFPVLCLTP